MNFNRTYALLMFRTLLLVIIFPFTCERHDVVHLHINSHKVTNNNLRNANPDHFQTLNAYWCVSEFISAIPNIENLRMESSNYEGSICYVVQKSSL
jgi:hypothetical protein